MFEAQTDDGRSIHLRATRRSESGDLEIELEFSLPWASGRIRGTCGEDRWADLERSLDRLLNGRDDRLTFINEHGNVDISVVAIRSGQFQVKVEVMPNMIDEDRLAFGLQGQVRRT